jgi:PPOX class probable F420-dependent enzyme
MTALDPASRALLEGANVAHLATLAADGSPHLAPVWVSLDGDRLVVFKEEGSLGLRNVRRDPRVALTVVDPASPYRYSAVRGRVEEERQGAEALEALDRIAISYTGSPYPDPRPGALLVIEPRRVSYVDLGDF